MERQQKIYLVFKIVFSAILPKKKMKEKKTERSLAVIMGFKKDHRGAPRSLRVTRRCLKGFQPVGGWKIS